MRTPQPSVSYTLLQQTADEIFNTRPEITDETLTEDAEVIENSMPAIQLDFMKRGFSRADAQAAALAGWKLLRIEKLRTTAVLSAREFVDCVSGLGMLVIKTTPAGADIYLDYRLVVDDKGHHIRTEACRWPSAGKHHVKLILPGYEIVEEDCVLEEEGQIILDKKLKPIEKKEPE